MPTYEYRCQNGHVFDVMQSMSDDPVETCQICGAPVERVFHPVAVHFKGSGFYTTDYGRNRTAASDSGSKEESKTEAAGSKSEAAGSKSESTSSNSDSGSSSGSSGDS